MLEGDEDDEPNTYDYTDSFIDDDEEEGGMCDGVVCVCEVGIVCELWNKGW